jgi:mercuric ion binding protein
MVRITVQRIPGVKSVDANAVQQSAVVVFDDTKTSVQAIKDALTQAGYPPLNKVDYLN